MKQGLIAVGVVAVGVLVFFLIRSPSSSSKAEGGKSEKVVSSGGGASSMPTPKRMGNDAPDVVAPKRYTGNDTTRPAPREYMRDDGTTVRDHRSNAPEPNLDRHPTLPKSISKVQPATLRAVRLTLRPAMQDCIATHAADSKGAKAQAVLTVSIASEQLKVDKLDFQTEGLSAETEEALRTCATTAILGHEQPIEGSPDVERHIMTFPYNL